MKAFLKQYRQSPRKVRLVADAIRGKAVPHARLALDMAGKRAAAPVKKLLNSAVANAKAKDTETHDENLFVKEIRVDEGPTLRRFRPRARGSAYRINKRTSHIRITLGDKAENSAKDKGE